MPMPGITCASAHGTRKQPRSLILRQVASEESGRTGTCFPKNFMLEQPASDRGLERSAMSLNRAMGRAWATVCKSYQASVASSLTPYGARAPPPARAAPSRTPKNRGGDTGLATFRLTAPNLRAGLRYDDIKIEQNPDVVKALERIPADELVNRCVAAARASFSESVFSPISRSASLSSNRRLKRAFDIDLKGSWLSPEMQAMQTPFEVRLARPAAFPSVSPLTFAPSQPYLTHEEDEAKQLRQERELLNGPCPWL